MVGDSDTKIRIRFIWNPTAGGKKGDRIESALQLHLDHDKFDYSLTRTERPHHATELVRSAANEDYQVVVAVGGDGTVNEVANGVIDTDLIMGIIPIGSGDGLALHLGIPRTLKKSIELINRMNVDRIDAVQTNIGWCCSSFGKGFVSEVAKAMGEQKHRGVWGYARSISRRFFKYQFPLIDMELDGQQFIGPFLQVDVFNSDQWGNNVKMIPEANARDGLLNVFIFPKFSKLLVFFYIFLGLIGLGKWIPGSQVQTARKVIFRSGDQKIQDIHIDGECFPCEGDFEAEVVSGILPMLVP